MANASGVEIVVRDCPADRVAAWLATIAGPLAGPTDAGGAAVYGTRLGTVVVQPGMGGPGEVGVWFTAAVLPWASAAACARQAAGELGCVVWCEPGEACPDVHPLSPAFLEIGGGGERLVEVPDAEPLYGPSDLNKNDESSHLA